MASSSWLDSYASPDSIGAYNSTAYDGFEYLPSQGNSSYVQPQPQQQQQLLQPGGGGGGDGMQSMSAAGLLAAALQPPTAAFPPPAHHQDAGASQLAQQLFPSSSASGHAQQAYVAAHSPSPTAQAYVATNPVTRATKSASHIPAQKGGAQQPYFASLWSKRRDVSRLIILSITILLGISLHWFAQHYITTYLEEHAFDLTWWQELAARFAYPLLVVIVLWHCKTYLVR